MFDGRVGGLRGFEALVRWPGPDGHTRQPADFVPVAEATGLVVQLDRWILDQACRLAAGWPAHLHVSTNLSAANFFAGDLVGDVQAVLARHGLAPGRLRLEVTETVLLCDPDRVRRTIAALQDGGVQVVLDDFGIGHASIAYLRDYAFDGLKVDRSFVSGIEADPQSRTLVRAMIEMAHALGIEFDGRGCGDRGPASDAARGGDRGRPGLPPGPSHDARRRRKPDRAEGPADRKAVPTGHVIPTDPCVDRSRQIVSSRVLSVRTGKA